MARPLRIDYPDAWFHVMNRGACRQPIFREKIHFEMFLELIAEVTLKFKVEIHAYCLMSNHYHLLIRTPHANLSRSIQHLASVYTRRYNTLEDRNDGPLFRGRFKSILVDSESYLLQLFRYIHLNPYKAKLVRNLADYEWSSFKDYVKLRDVPHWLFLDEIYGYFDKKNLVEEIHRYTMAGGLCEIDKFYSEKKIAPILGSPEFIETIKSEHQFNSISKEISDKKILRPLMSDIISAVAHTKSVTEKDIIISNRGYANHARDLAIMVAKNHYGYRISEISEKFNITSPSGVSNASLRAMKAMKSSENLNNNYVRAIELLENRDFRR